MRAVAVPSLESCVHAAVERRTVEEERARAARVAQWDADRAVALETQRQGLEALFTREQRNILSYRVTGAPMPPSGQGDETAVWAEFTYLGQRIRLVWGTWLGGRLEVRDDDSEDWEVVGGPDFWGSLPLMLDYLVPQAGAR